MESSTAFSPDHEIAVSGENGEAKGPPMRGCFAPQRRINLSSVNQRDCVPTRAGATVRSCLVKAGCSTNEQAPPCGITTTVMLETDTTVTSTEHEIAQFLNAHHWCKKCRWPTAECGTGVCFSRLRSCSAEQGAEVRPPRRPHPSSRGLDPTDSEFPAFRFLSRTFLLASLDREQFCLVETFGSRSPNREHSGWDVLHLRQRISC